MFANSKAPVGNFGVAKLYRGITDFGKLEQFNPLDTGRSFLKILTKPVFLTKQTVKERVALLDEFCRICEYEFKGFDGIEDMSVDTLELNDGLNNTLNLINKVKEQSASTFSQKLVEKTGSPITKFTRMYLTGIYDPRTGYKHYHGLNNPSNKENYVKGGFENEIFTLLYWVVDSSGWEIEKAYLIVGAQLTKSNESIYNSEKGSHDQKEINIEWSGFPITGDAVNALAKEQLAVTYIVRNSDQASFGQDFYNSQSTTLKVNDSEIPVK